jgi:hypothetical protein
MRSLAERTLFVGGDVTLPSVQMRCRQIAEAIGAAWTAPSAPGDRWRPSAESLEGRDLFVLVKATVDVRELAARGRIIWDVLDAAPPRTHIDAYLTSTQIVSRLLGPHRAAYAIPQHHCNAGETFLSPDRTRGRMVWIGAAEWLPEELAHQGVEVHTVGALDGEALAVLYGRADVLVNARRFDARMPSLHLFHTVLNAGIKVINAVGFGLPSVTEWEPWVDEIGVGCTEVCAPGEAAACARRLLQSADRYQALRDRCREAADRYSLRSAAASYVRMLEEVAAQAPR